MTFTLGLVLLAVTVAMIVVARPARDGTPVAFLRNWAVGQVYALSAMTSAVVGTSLVLSDWPL